jgi:hypothetical protein
MTRHELIQTKERQRFALASILDWWDGIPNDTRELLEINGRPPACILRAYAICECGPEDVPPMNGDSTYTAREWKEQWE